MKPKEIIEQASLYKGFNRKSQGILFSIMTSELRDTYNRYGVKDSHRHFDAAVKILRSKWDSISMKIPYGLSEGVWRFFYARWVAPMKRELCPTWKKHNDEWLSRRGKQLRYNK